MKNWEDLRREGTWSLSRTWYEIYKQFQVWAEAGYRAKGWSGLGLGHVHFLAQVAAVGTRLTDIARLIGTTKQYAGRVAQELEAAGLVTSQSDPTDRRAVLILPTERGHQFLADACEIRGALEARFLATLGPDRAAALMEAIEILGQSVKSI